MFFIAKPNIRARRVAIPFSLAVASVGFAPSAALAQEFLGVPPGGTKAVCVSDSGTIYINDDSDTCTVESPDNVTTPTGLQVANATFNETTNATTFTGGTVLINGPLTITAPTAVNATTTFGGSTTFNALADFNNGITSNTITNSGTVSTSLLNATTVSAGTIVGASVTASGSLLVSPSSTVDMGNNRIQFVAAGVADTDAVNVAQLNAATSGITADVTALETTTATHSTQIANLETTTAAHGTTIAQHTTQIAAIESVNTTQASQITAIQALNTTQSNQISALQAAQDLVDSRVDTLFDLRSSDRRDMKQGVASAMAMASAPMPSEPGRVAYAVNGATFRGQYAVGGSVSYRLPGARSFSVNAGFSYAGNKNNGARIGFAGEF